MFENSNPQILGRTIDAQTRCIHYHSELDIIALKFKCCQHYYPCYTCHEEATQHTPQIWSRHEFDNKAIVCGVCKTEMTINEYLESRSQCPCCQSLFNPKCSNHHHLYFEV
jgi:uncharacterized CHY-type Zn-finger protein